MTHNEATILAACIEATVNVVGFIAGAVIGARHFAQSGADRIAAAAKMALAEMAAADKLRGGVERTTYDHRD